MKTHRFAPLCAALALMYSMGLCTPAQAQNEDQWYLRAPQGEAPPVRARRLPVDAQRGIVTFVAPPAVLIDGKEARLGPGSRIYDTRSAMVFAQRLRGQRVEALYTLAVNGRIGDVWLLTDLEATSGQLPSQRRERALRMQGVDPTRKVQRSTPFDQLPQYPVAP